MEFVKLYVLHLRQCDPSKCTALRLAKSKLIHLVNKLSDLPRGSVVLFPHPFADVVLAPMDRELIISRGLSAIDCSWKKLHELSIQVSKRGRLEYRALPLLIAGNPINYGKLSMLSTVEALAAALYITGFKKQAIYLLSKFKWGETFLQLNKQLLEDYSKAETREQVLEVQKLYL